VQTLTMLKNFLIRELLGLFDSGSQKSDNCHGAVTRFLEIDANLPSVSVLSDQSFSSCVVDSSEPSRVGHFNKTKRGKTGRRPWRITPTT
jgi:hypothetical protein